MIVKDVNRADIQEIKWRNKTVKTGIFKLPINGSAEFGQHGLEMDHVVDKKYHGGVDMKVYAYSADHYDFWKKKYPYLTFHSGMFGENITLEGLNEKDVNIGDIWEFDKDFKIQVTQPRQPCFKLGVKFGTQKIVKEFINAPFPGLYFKILNCGCISRDSQIKVFKEEKYHLAVLEVWDALYENDFSRERIVEILQNPFLSEDCKVNLRKKVK